MALPWDGGPSADRVRGGYTTDKLIGEAGSDFLGDGNSGETINEPVIEEPPVETVSVP